MKEIELFAYLGIKGHEELEDCYEDKIFNHKHFFLTSPTARKVFDQRIRKIVKEKNVFDELGYYSNELQLTFSLVEFPNSNEINLIYSHYQYLKNDLKLRLFSSNSIENILFCASKKLELETIYSEYWQSDRLDEMENPLKENDEMLVLEAIRLFQQNGGKTFDDLKNNRNNPPDLLLKEMKRLNLIRSKFL